MISAHLQDAVMRMGDMDWQPGATRFAAVLGRFDWLRAQDATVQQAKSFERRLAALRIDRVTAAQTSGLAGADADDLLKLLAIAFEPTDPPSGRLLLCFSGEISVRLDVECIEASLTDLGPAWRTRQLPAHREQ